MSSSGFVGFLASYETRRGVVKFLETHCVARPLTSTHGSGSTDLLGLVKRERACAYLLVRVLFRPPGNASSGRRSGPTSTPRPDPSPRSGLSRGPVETLNDTCAVRITRFLTSRSH